MSERSPRRRRAAAFGLTLLVFALTLIVLAYAMFGSELIGEVMFGAQTLVYTPLFFFMKAAFFAVLLSIIGAAVTSLGMRLVPAGRRGRMVLFMAIYAACWLGAAYQVVLQFEPDLGMTFGEWELWGWMMLGEYATAPLLVIGMVISAFIHRRLRADC